MKKHYFFILKIWLLISATFAVGQHIPENKILFYEDAVNIPLCSSHSISINSDTLSTAFIMAASFFPELCGRKISLQYGRIGTSMAAQPRILSIFRSRDKRSYRLIVNRDAHKGQTQLLYTAPFNALVGVMGHELVHIQNYTTKSGLQMVWLGVRYLGKNYRRELERQTDLATIDRGLGWQLYHFSYYVINIADIEEEYRRYKLEVYMTPEKIFELINREVE